MSSKLQLYVCHISHWWRHPVNAYEVEADMVYFAGNTVIRIPERLECGVLQSRI